MLGKVALEAWMAGVVLSLISIGLVIVLGAGVCLLTVARATRRARRRPPDLGQLSRWSSVSELAEIDEALDRILAEEHAALPGRLPG